MTHSLYLIHRAFSEMSCQVVELNIGGHYFTTTRTTLTKEPESMLARMFEGDLEPSCKDSSGRYFIDRDGSAFQHVLTYLRGEKLPLAAFGADRLHLDAEYYQVRAAGPAAFHIALSQSGRTDMPTVLQLDGLGEFCKDNMTYAVGVKRAHAAAVEAAGQPFQDAKAAVLRRFWEESSSPSSNQFVQLWESSSSFNRHRTVGLDVIRIIDTHADLMAIELCVMGFQLDHEGHARDDFDDQNCHSKRASISPHTNVEF